MSLCGPNKSEEPEENGPSQNSQGINEERTEWQKCRIRNLIAYWIMGLCNNFAMVVMLSAAHDILRQKGDQPKPDNTTTPASPEWTTPEVTTVWEPTHHIHQLCNRIGTGAILLAVVVPCFVINMTAAWYIHKIPYSIKVLIVVLSGEASYIIVATSDVVWLSILGAACASVSSGFGELSFLSLASHFHKNVVSSWASGTGAAGLVGSLSYAGLTALGLSPQLTIYCMTVVPVLQASTYFLMLVKPTSVREGSCSMCVNREEMLDEPVGETTPMLKGSSTQEVPKVQPTFKQKVYLLKPLMKFIIPISIVYGSQYFINHALVELITFENIWLPVEQQYRWYMTFYQVGVFVARSTVTICPIRHLWIFPLFQLCILACLLSQIFVDYMSSIFMVFAFILVEGLIGGWSYVNTFYRVITEAPEAYREFSMGAVAVGYQAGMAMSGAVAVPVHTVICNQ